MIIWKHAKYFKLYIKFYELFKNWKLKTELFCKNLGIILNNCKIINENYYYHYEIFSNHFIYSIPLCLRHYNILFFMYLLNI